jgi:hypothetical protein
MIEINPILRHVKPPQDFALRREVLALGRAAGVTDEDSRPTADADSWSSPVAGVISGPLIPS